MFTIRQANRHAEKNILSFLAGEVYPITDMYILTSLNINFLPLSSTQSPL